jgi:Ca-activated chloride channel family protein
MSEALARLLPALGIDAIERPLLGALVALAALTAWIVATRRRGARSLAWPALAEVRAAGAGRFDPRRAAGFALRAAALVALAGALAGPVALLDAGEDETRGLDLVLVLDVSGSMRALDAEVHGEWRTRFELAREVVGGFAARRVADGDRVALVVFGETAFTQCPLTRDGELLAASLARVDVGMAGEATALGDALALAVKRAGTDAGVGPAEAPREGRLVVLLTDGRSNAGSVPLGIAASLAAERGVRVHAVGIGSTGEVAMARPEGAAGAQPFERHDLDARALEAVAAATQGRFFPARTSADLAAVYAAIDELERVDRPLPRPARRAPRPEGLLLAAGALVALELAAARGIGRTLP